MDLREALNAALQERVGSTPSFVDEPDEDTGSRFDVEFDRTTSDVPDDEPDEEPDQDEEADQEIEPEDEPADDESPPEDSGGGDHAAQEPTPEPTWDPAAYLEQRYGRPPTQAELDELFGFVQRVSSLDPRSQQAVVAILNGESFSEPDPEPEPQREELKLPEELEDDPLAQLLVKQSESIEDLKQKLAAQEQQAAARSQQEHQQIVAAETDRGAASWREQHGDLTEDQYRRLETSIIQANVFPMFYARANNDAAKAVQDALDWAMYTDPELRESIISREAAQRNAADESKSRKEKAAALGGHSSQAPRSRDTVPRDGKADELAEALRQAMSQ